MTEEQKKEDGRITLYYKDISAEMFMSILKSLAMNYPDCFSFREQKILKVGIVKDLLGEHLKHKVPKNKIKLFLLHYTNTPEYMEKHIIGADRHDLWGNIVGKVTEVEQKIKKKANNLYYHYKNKKEQLKVSQKSLKNQ